MTGICTRLGDQRLPAISWVLASLATLALEQGDWTAAQCHAAESLTTVRVSGSDRVPPFAGAPLPVGLEVSGAPAIVQGVPLRAVRLVGAAAGLRRQLNQPLTPSEQDALERRLAPARQALSAEPWAGAWAEGQRMTRDEAIADALEWA